MLQNVLKLALKPYLKLSIFQQVNKLTVQTCLSNVNSEKLSTLSRTNLYVYVGKEEKLRSGPVIQKL